LEIIFILRTTVMKKYLSLCMPITVAMLLAACGGGGGSDDPAPLAGPSNPPADGPSVPVPRTINGKLVMPNGETPLSNGLIYIPVDATAAKTIVSQKVRHKPARATAVAEGGCGTPPVAVVAQACTRSDGSFTLDATFPAGNFPLVAHKGVFTTQANLVIGADTTVNMEPVKIDVGNVKMAVVGGVYDHLEWVLADIGFAEKDGAFLKHGTQKFDLYDGSGVGFIDAPAGTAPYPSAKELYTQRKDGSFPINDYDVVFINCGVDEENIMSIPDVAPVLRDYVNNGGRVYITDRSYDFVEQAFPEYIDFYGSDGVDEKDPEFIDSAEEGSSLTETDATFSPSRQGEDLKSYLAGVPCVLGSCLNANGTVHIDSFSGGWAVINGVHAAHANDTTLWMEGNVLLGFDDIPAVKPLVASFPFGQGMVMYSSYHTHGGVNTPTEWIMQYLVFELE